MKHAPIRLHPIECRCAQCDQRPVMPIKPILLSALGAALPVYGLLWAVWTIFPN